VNNFEVRRYDLPEQQSGLSEEQLNKKVEDMASRFDEICSRIDEMERIGTFPVKLEK